MQWYLLYTVYMAGQIQPEQIQQCRGHVHRVIKLSTRLSLGFDALRPTD